MIMVFRSLVLLVSVSGTLCRSPSADACANAEIGIHYTTNNWIHKTENVTDYTTCCAMCASTAKCRSWIWHKPSAKSNPLLCKLLLDEPGQRKSDADFVSGGSSSPTPPSPTRRSLNWGICPCRQKSQTRERQGKEHEG